MAEDAFYNSPEWRAVREQVLVRDADACVLRRFVGGACSGPLHVHHLERRRDRPDLALDPENLVTCCERHHPSLEGFRLFVIRLRRPLPPCRHHHRYSHAQRECDRRRARQLGIVIEERDPVAASACAA